MDIRALMMKFKKLIILMLFVYNQMVTFKFRIKGRNNKIKNISRCLLKRVGIRISGNNNIIMLGHFSRLSQCSIFIKGNNNIIKIGDHTFLDCADFHIEDSGNKILIGEHTSIHGKTQLAAIEGTTINIGNDCMFSSI